MTQLCQRLDDYLDDLMSPVELEHFEHHLKGCPDCQRAVRFEQALGIAARKGAELVSVPALVGTRVLEKSQRQRRTAMTAAVAVTAAVSRCSPICLS